MNQCIRVFAPSQSQAPKASARAFIYHKLRMRQLCRRWLRGLRSPCKRHLEARQSGLQIASYALADERDQRRQRIDRRARLGKLTRLELPVGERCERRARRDEERLDAERPDL